jgi:predicted dehydrogenase
MSPPISTSPLPFSRRRFLGTAAAGAVTALQLSSSSAAQSAKPRLKVGQIGVGHAHASKLGVYRESTEYEVVGIVEPDAGLRAEAEKQPAYRDLKWMAEDELLKTPGLAAVLVETRVRDLLNTAERCIAAGKHIHLDKPAGQSLPQYRRLLDAAAKQNLLVQMGYMFRYNPGVLLLKRFLKEGWLGDVFEVHTVISKVVPPNDRKELAEYPGGMMFELGCHVIDLVVGILGKPGQVRAFPRSSGPADGLIDNMLAVFEYPRATASVRSSALEVDGFARRHLTVCGTGGTFHIQPLDSPSVRLTLDRERGEYRKGQQEIRFDPFRRYVADAADMARIIRGEKPTDFSYAHDLAVQETVLLASGLPAPLN